MESVDDSGWLKVMVPFHVDVHQRVAHHRYGKAASILFVWLLAAAKVGNYQEPGGWVVMSSARLQWLGLSGNTRTRGLRALEELGLVELRQEGNQAYRARLLYNAADADGLIYVEDDGSVPVSDLTEAYAERLGRAA